MKDVPGEKKGHGVKSSDGRIKVIHDFVSAFRNFEFVSDIAPEVLQVGFGLGRDDDGILCHLALAFAWRRRKSSWAVETGRVRPASAEQ